MNGWQRTFVMVTGIWGLICAVGVTFFLLGDSSFEASLTGSDNRFSSLPTGDILGWGISIWAAPCITLYLLGLGIAWVRRGFRST